MRRIGPVQQRFLLKRFAREAPENIEEGRISQVFFSVISVSSEAELNPPFAPGVHFIQGRL